MLRNAAVVAVLWTLVVTAALTWNFVNKQRFVLEMARVHARGLFERDLIYRRWSSINGGAYVPISEQTQPNPYLNVEERDISTPSGRQLTLVNPAFMTRQVHELAEREFGVFSHITSLDPLRPENAADPWEKSALMAFEQDETEVSSVEDIDGKSFLRLMRPLVTEQGCLKCHAIQGYSLGDIRGGISVAVPLANQRSFAWRHFLFDVLSYGLVWLLGLGGLALTFHRQKIHRYERIRIEKELADHLENLVGKRTAELAELNREQQLILDSTRATIWYKDTKNNILRVNKAASESVGLTAAEIEGKSTEELFPGEAAKYYQDDLAVIESGQPKLGIVETLRTQSGDVLCVLTDKIPIVDKTGRVTGIVAFAINITERKQAEEALEKRSAELRKMVNLMAGRENRMADLKETIKKLRSQLKDAGLKPVADDPLKEKEVRPHDSE